MVTVFGNGALQISHSNFEKLYESTMSFNYFFTLLLIQFLRQPTCINSQEPLHKQGLIKGSSYVDSSHKQILHEPVNGFSTT